MKKLTPIALALALAFPFAASAASSNADLQKEIELLKAQVAELKQLVTKQVKAPAPVVSNDTAALKSEVAAMRIKMDAMEEAHTQSGFEGIKFSGSIDPTYIYSQRAGRGQTVFLNGTDGATNDLTTDAFGYQNSNFGGVTLKFEKEFDNGMKAAVKLRPYKSTNTTWVEEAFVTLPFGENGMNVLVGKQNSWNGYEVVDSSESKLVTKGLLFDFGGPLSMSGAGLTFSGLGMDWKTIAGNMNSDTDLPGKANHNRGIHWRGDKEVSEFAGWGISGMHGTLGGEAYHYLDADFWYTRGDWTFNGQIEGSTHKNSAFNGGNAKTLGLSGLAALKLGEGWEAVVRADWLKDRKNGGSRSSGECDFGTTTTGWIDLNGDGIVDPGESGAVDLNGDGVLDTVADSCGDYRNGFGPGMTYDAVNSVWVLGNPDKGATRTAITFGLNYQFHENALLKLEVRHDMSDRNSFLDYKDGSFKKSNTTFGAQTVVKF